MDDVDEFPEVFKCFLENILERAEPSIISLVIIKTIKAILQTLPGLYRETIEKSLQVLEEQCSEVLTLCSE